MGSPGLRQRSEGGSRLVPVCVLLEARQLVQVAALAPSSASPGEVVEEALWLWTQREYRRVRRSVAARARELAVLAEEWDPVGDLVALADWQVAFDEYSPSEVLPMMRPCRPTVKRRGSAMSAPAPPERVLRRTPLDVLGER